MLYIVRLGEKIFLNLVGPLWLGGGTHCSGQIETTHHLRGGPLSQVVERIVLYYLLAISY